MTSGLGNMPAVIEQKLKHAHVPLIIIHPMQWKNLAIEYMTI